MRWGAPYTETVRLGVMSSSSGSNASSLWFNSSSAGSNYSFSSPSFVEGSTPLSSKYLGISASIPSSRISDWGTYINQPLLTTSSPTFAGLTLTGLITASGGISGNLTGTASNASALGGKSPSWYLPGGQYSIPAGVGAPDYTLLFTVVFSTQYQCFNNEVY